MSKTVVFLLLLRGILIPVVSSQLVSFTGLNDPCACSLSACTCCAGIKVPPINLTKNVCVVLSVNISTYMVQVTIKLDSKVLTQFEFSGKNPPTTCVPIALPFNMNMCLKVHDVKVLNQTGMQICMSIFGTFQGKNAIVIPFNCVKVVFATVNYFTTVAPSSG